jgi:hypothetical protein
MADQSSRDNQGIRRRSGSQIPSERRGKREAAPAEQPIEIKFPERSSEPLPETGSAARRRRKKARRAEQLMAEVEEPLLPAPGFTEQALSLARVWRLVMVGVFGLCFTLAVTPLVDNLYTTYFFSMDTRIVPSLVSSALGIVVYIAGWRLLVGMRGEVPKPTRAAFWYLVAGIVCVGLVLVLLGIGVYGNLQLSRGQ